jgi:hypothetical protein
MKQAMEQESTDNLSVIILGFRNFATTVSGYQVRRLTDKDTGKSSGHHKSNAFGAGDIKPYNLQLNPLKMTQNRHGDPNDAQTSYIPGSV